MCRIRVIDTCQRAGRRIERCGYYCAVQKRLRQQTVPGKNRNRSRNRKTYDQVDLEQMSLFDTVKDEDILKELQ